MRVHLLALALLLTGCGSSPLLVADRAGGELGASAKKNPGKRDAGQLVTKKPVTPLPANLALVFKYLDRDADGAIAASEWPFDAGRVARGAPVHATGDKDRDGRLSEDEWVAFATPRFKDAPFAGADIAGGFLKVDLDASGKLTADELGLFARGLEPRVREALYFDAEPIARFMMTGDADHDFALDPTEFERLAAQLMVRRFGDVS